MGLVLVVEDEVDLNNLIRDQLVGAGHSVEQAFDGGSAVAAIEKSVPDLVLLDWMLPDLDGLTVCRRIRERHVMPVIMLTARTDEIDRVVGLEVGADDYVTKPFSMRELLARVKAILRRRELLAEELRRTAREGDQITIGPLTVELARRRVYRSGQEIALKPKEFDLLAFLARHQGQVLSPEQLVEQVWGYDSLGDVSTVRVHVRSLREKIEEDPSNPRLVETVRGVGYRLAD